MSVRVLLVLALSSSCLALAQEDGGVPEAALSLEVDGGAPGEADAGSKFEWAVFPVLAGSTDIGFEFGAFTVITKLAPPGVDIPWQWSLSAQLAMSINGKPGGGVEFPVHDDNISIDWRSLDTRWRVVAQFWFWRAVDSGFYGVGNLSLPTGDPNATSVRSTQYIRNELVLESDVAWQAFKVLRFRGGLLGRRVAPEAYPDSTLALAAQSEPLLLGMQTHYSLIATVGVELDTRDNEIAPNRGVYMTGTLRGSAGALTGNDLSWGGTNLHLRGYYDVWPGRVVLGARLLIDTVFGRPPLQEFSRSGGFESVWMLGGSGGARGIPEGRYQGRIRLTGNLEARVNLFGFDLWDIHFGVGMVAFVDGGRVWADWVPRPDLDGTGVGLHLTYGGGLRLRIGDTIMIRFDFAWSPPPASTPDEPFGFYADLGHVF